MPTIKNACEKCETTEHPAWGVVCPKCKTPLRSYTKKKGQAFWNEGTKIVNIGSTVKPIGKPEKDTVRGTLKFNPKIIK